VQLQRITGQGPETLEEFYSGLARHEVYADRGNKMLLLLGKLKQIPWDGDLWGSTHLTSLNIVAEDNSESPALATVYNDDYFFTIRFPLSESDAPWPAETWMYGSTEDLEEATNMVHIALQRCAWTNLRLGDSNAAPNSGSERTEE